MTGHLERHLAESDAAANVSRVRGLERQLAATVDELTAAQTDNERLSGYLVDAFEQRDAAQAARAQAEAQRDRALEQLAQARAEGVAAERHRWVCMTTVQADTARGFW